MWRGTWIAGQTTNAPRHDPQEGSVPTDGRPVRINSELAVRQIAQDTFVVTHEPAFDSNILVVRLADGTVVLCSSPFDTHATRIMLRWIRDVFAPGRMLAINTHFHPDGTAGNEAYAEAGVETYATDLTQRLLAERGAQVRDGAAAALENPALASRVRGTRIVPAARTIKAADGVIFTTGGEAVHVIYPGPAHSPDNVVVHFPARGILFGGCMIKTGGAIGNTVTRISDTGRQPCDLWNGWGHESLFLGMAPSVVQNFSRIRLPSSKPSIHRRRAFALDRSIARTHAPKQQPAPRCSSVLPAGRLRRRTQAWLRQIPDSDSWLIFSAAKWCAILSPRVLAVRSSDSVDCCPTRRWADGLGVKQ